MWVETISKTIIKKSRKDHDCNACEWVRAEIDARGGDLGLTFAEYRQVIKARSDNWKVKKGTEYIRLVIKQDGELYSVAIRPDIDAICKKYKFYENY